MHVLANLGIFALERFIPFLLYFYFLYLEDITLIKALTTVQLIAAITELGIRNSIGVEKRNIITIIRLHIVVSLLVLMFFILISEITYFYLYCVIQIMIAAGAAYKIKCITAVTFFGLALMLFICLFGMMVSDIFILALSFLYFILTLKLLEFVKGADGFIEFLLNTDVSKYSVLSLPIVIAVPFDLFLSSIVIDEFITYHSTVRMMVIISIPFVIYNYFNNINIQKYTYKNFLKANFMLYLKLLILSFILMYLIEMLDVIEIDSRLAASYIALMIFGPIYQFLLRLNKRLAALYLLFFYLASFLPYLYSDILGAKFIFNLFYFSLMCLFVIFTVKYESNSS